MDLLKVKYFLHLLIILAIWCKILKKYWQKACVYIIYVYAFGDAWNI